MLFDKCERAYTKKEFDFNMSTMVSINPGIKQYLLDADPTKWARSHFLSKTLQFDDDKYLRVHECYLKGCKE